MDNLAAAFCVNFGHIGGLFGCVFQTMENKAYAERKTGAVGIIGKDYFPTGTKDNPSRGFFVVSYIDRENVRGTVRLEKSLTGLVSVGDVGIVAIQGEKLIKF